jgi:isoleucyl-tRNA synthetase
MSAFYLDVLKDRLYTAPAKSLARRSAQTAMYRILDALTRLIAPVLSFTADEIWQHLPGEREKSVHLAGFPRFEASLLDAGLEARYERLLEVRSEVSRALELARNAKTIGHSLDARVTLFTDDPACRELLEDYRDELATLFIVSQAELADSRPEGIAGQELTHLTIAVEKAAGEKCERCWNYRTSVGESDEHPTVCHSCREAMA